MPKMHDLHDPTTNAEKKPAEYQPEAWAGNALYLAGRGKRECEYKPFKEQELQATKTRQHQTEYEQASLPPAKKRGECCSQRYQNREYEQHDQQRNDGIQYVKRYLPID